MKDLIGKLDTNAKTILAVILMLSFIDSCMNYRRTKSIIKKLEITNDRITDIKNHNDSLALVIIRQNQIQTLISNKNILYDWNTIVRTTTRPDDVLMRYDSIIMSLSTSR